MFGTCGLPLMLGAVVSDRGCPMMTLVRPLLTAVVPPIEVALTVTPISEPMSATVSV